MEKVHWKKVFNSDFLGSCDLEDGQDLKATIKSVTVKTVKGNDGTSKECNVATFTSQAIKPMILNATNCKVVKKFSGSPYINDWNNIAVQIYIQDGIKAFGETTEGLRIRSIQPKMAKTALSPKMQAWAGAVAFLKGEGTMDGIKQRYDLTAEVEEQLRVEVLS